MSVCVLESVRGHLHRHVHVGGQGDMSMADRKHAIHDVENIAPVTGALLKVYDSAESPLHHHSKESMHRRGFIQPLL